MKLYTKKQFYVGTFLGGPIVGGIIAYHNFKRTGDEKKAHLSILFALLITVLLFTTLARLPESVAEKIPNYLIPLLYSGILASIFDRFQGEEIKAFFLNDGLKESNWKVFGLTLIGLIVSLVFLFQIALLQPPFPGSSMSFDGNEIYFDKETDQKDVEKLADVFFSFGYFEPGLGNVAHIEAWETRYLVTLPIDESFWKDEQVISELEDLKVKLEVAFLKDITLKLESYKLTGQKIEKRIGID